MNEFDDVDLQHTYIEGSDDYTANLIIRFFRVESLLVYPAKSYFVAIVYAYCLQKYFNEDFYTVLDDKELLPDDTYFIPYSSNKYIYDKVLGQIGDISKYTSIEKTVKYFKQEMLLED
jgi:hypothetical protein